MRWRYIWNVVGALILFFGLTMLLPLAAAIIYLDSSIMPLLKAMGVSIFIGAFLWLVTSLMVNKSL